MSSQDDLGMLWYGVSGVPFNPADPAEVMLNTGITAPLLSDHPRALVAPQASQTSLAPGTIYGDPNISQQNQMLYDPQTGDFITQTDYMYDTYDGYEEDSSSTTNSLNAQNNHHFLNSQGNDEESNPLPKTKKPKVHQHPALKLKTPIAYQKDTDLNAIPIMKEGMAVCKKCGAIGVKHAFYGKERKFCSLACARPPMQSVNLMSKGSNDIKLINKIEGGGDSTLINSANTMEENCTPKIIETKNEQNLCITSQLEFDSHSKDSSEVPHNVKMTLSECEDYFSYIANKNLQDVSNTTSLTPLPQDTPTYLPQAYSKDGHSDSYQWEGYLKDKNFFSASVKSFKHAPMSECWEQISPGMKVEVSCGEESLMKDAFWVATVVSLFGYKAKLRFEGFIDDASKDIWVDLCSEEVHPVGWCATQGKPLIPPKSIQFKYKDWKEFLMKRLTGARTLPTNFHIKVTESLKSRFRPGLNLEVVDKNRIAQMRVATVTQVVGKRIHLRYHGAPPDDNGFWCHEDATIIHPVGWSREVGHEIVASQSYHEKCLEVAYDPDDATSDLFVDPNRSGYTGSIEQTFAEGMKLEAIDPLNLSTICVATVMKVLSHNYLMIRIDSYDNDNTCSDWFCYHASSTSIFPAGFCEMNDLTLTPPRGFEGQFSWYNYLTKTQATAAPPVLFTRDIPNHGFKVGMSLEAADLMDPRLVCVAKVKDVKGRLLKIHFDGWEDDFDQWVDCSSTDVYPVGWCNLVGYKLEGPRLTVSVSLPFVQRKKVGRGRGGRKGRPFGTRRGNYHSRITENVAPVPSLIPMGGQGFPSTMSKRGRKPRQRGNSILTHSVRENQRLGSDDFSFDQDSSSDIPYNSTNETNHYYTGKRGRPRKNLLKPNSHDTFTAHAQQARPVPSSRTAMPAYMQSEEDVSDETSSGVASLAGSENSSEAWDMDQYNLNPLQEVQNNANCDNLETDMKAIDSQNFIDQLTPLPTDTGYRERPPSVNFKSITDDSDLFGDEGPNLESFLTNTVESIPLSDNSSDFHVSSSFDVSLEKTSLTPPTNSVFGTCVTSSSEEQLTENSNDNSAIVEQTVKMENNYHENIPGNVSENIPGNAPENIPGNVSENIPGNAPENIPGNSSENIPVLECDKFIPRIIDNSNVLRGGKIQPKLWSHQDVATFLRVNDCGAYCDNFISQKIDGVKFLKLAQTEVMGLTGMKVGPSLKIHDLIQQLLAIVNPAQARYQATLLKRGLSFGKS